MIAWGVRPLMSAAVVVLAAGCSSSGTVHVAASTGGNGGGGGGVAAVPSACTAANAMCGVFDGTWKSSDGTVTLVIDKAKAELKTPHDCPGDFDSAILLLTCADGYKDRQTGGASISADHKTLTVTWDDGIKDTLAKG